MKVLAAGRTLVYVIVFVLGWGWLARAAQRLDRHLGLQLPSWLQPLGYLMAAAGTVLVLVCLFAFAWRGRGTPAPFDAPRELIIWGPYRFVRNPIYVGVVAALVGIALALRSPPRCCWPPRRGSSPTRWWRSTRSRPFDVASERATSVTSSRSTAGCRGGRGPPAAAHGDALLLDGVDEAGEALGVHGGTLSRGAEGICGHGRCAPSVCSASLPQLALRRPVRASGL